MKIRWRYILLSLALTLLIVFAFWFPAYFHVFVIKPIVSILWLVYRTLSTVNQEVYWALLILTSLFLFFGMVPNQNKGLDRPAYQSSIHENNRVAYWEALLKSAEGSETDRLALQRKLGALNQAIGDLAEGNNEEDILLPPFRIYFQRRIQVAWISFSLSRLIQRKVAHEPTELEKHVDIIVKSMETRLEAHHDQGSNHPNDD